MAWHQSSNLVQTQLELNPGPLWLKISALALNHPDNPIILSNYHFINSIGFCISFQVENTARALFLRPMIGPETTQYEEVQKGLEEIRKVYFDRAPPSNSF